MSKPSRRKNREARKSSPGHPLNKVERKALKIKRAQNLAIVREKKNDMHAPITARTQARNCKSQATTLDQQRAEYEDIVGAQMKVWRKLLPSMIRQLSRIKDPRQTGKVKHQMAVIMFLGLMQFIFKLKSRREYNEELTCPHVVNTLRKLFPEIISVPHAETIARIHSVQRDNLINDGPQKKKKRHKQTKGRQTSIAGYFTLNNVTE